MLSAGCLVYLDIKNKFFTNDGFVTIHFENNSPVLYENISIEAYPSCNDFLGKYTKVAHNEPMIVLEYVGRPIKILNIPMWDCYDIYNVQLRSGEIRQVFNYNLSKFSMSLRKTSV